MSNGQPSFPPSGGNLPPFRPNFAPGAPPASLGLPPFPPKGFAQPPFAPNFSPGASGSRPPYSPSSSHSPHNLPRPPTGLPHPPHQSSRSTQSGKRDDVKTTKVFVGSIAPGISDHTLRNLLNACGPLYELKRVEGANGKPQAFGFASFESPEVVLRCIRCLNGVELPDLSPEGIQEGRPPKQLIVKADQKTAAFLQEFEETLGRSDSDDSADAACRAAISSIVRHLGDANALRMGDRGPRGSGRLSPIQVVVPAHLQDLKEGDLPETQRVAVLDQIAIFRENAARREREKKLADDERERYKNMSSAHVGYGYGTRAFAKPAVTEPAKSHDGNARALNTKSARDPQGYSEPVSFTRPESTEGKNDSERTDEEVEAALQQRRERDRALALRDREHRVESKERLRIENAMREQSTQQQRQEAERKSRRATTEKLEQWDDDEMDDRESFYEDRRHWRSQRQEVRLREEEQDLEDRRLEDMECKALEAESEDFLQKQMAELASTEEKQRQAGLLSEDAAPIKLAIVARALPEAEDKPATPHSAPKPALALGDDEDDTIVHKKKRALVKLEYEQGLDEAEERARRTARLLDISKQLPSDRSSVFNGSVNWDLLSSVTSRAKVSSYVERKITNALGGLDQDLADFVMEHLSTRKGPKELVDDLSPVLDEEAAVFVSQLWRQLLFETRAAAQGLDSGSMTV